METMSAFFNQLILKDPEDTTTIVFELVGITAAVVVASFFAWCSRRNSKAKQMTRQMNARSVYKADDSYRKASGRKSRSGLSNASTCASEFSAGSADSCDTEASNLRPAPGRGQSQVDRDPDNWRSTRRVRAPSHGTESERKRDGDVPVRNLRQILQGEQFGDDKKVPSNLMDILHKLSPEDAATVKQALKTGSLQKRMFTQRYETPQGETMQIRTPVRVDLSDSNTLKTNLRKLGNVEQERVLMLKKINKLGLNSPEILKKHFSKFGVVEDVFVTHSIDKRKVDDDGQMKPRVRPAGLGFLVMEKVENAEEIHRIGPQIEIHGVNILVTRYENHIPEKIQECDEDITGACVPEEAQDCDEDIAGACDDQ